MSRKDGLKCLQQSIQRDTPQLQLLSILEELVQHLRLQLPPGQRFLNGLLLLF